MQKSFRQTFRPKSSTGEGFLRIPECIREPPRVDFSADLSALLATQEKGKMGDRLPIKCPLERLDGLQPTRQGPSQVQSSKGSAGPASDSANLLYPWHPDSQSAVGQLCGRINAAVMSGKKTLKGAINDELAERDHKREIVVSDFGGSQPKSFPIT